MDHAITVRDCLIGGGIGIGGAVVLFGLVWILGVYGNAWRH